ncbi:MAG TPA: serine/threonine-protein kinase, partial [Kofleriaceae bacterium]|nr:serine/threonine-protein kinase [Kofleriaceae bacterium]
MAELFVATAPGEHGFQKRVVIKRLLPHLVDDPTYNAMFIDEAKLTARLVHPKIAQTFELGKVDGALYISMELVDGIDVLALLREFASKRRRVDQPLAAWIALEVLDALDYAHNITGEDGRPLGIVHRDISPSNVLLSVRGDIKLVDFGIARAVDPDRAHKSKTGTLKGKYGYMSPEQVIEQGLDARSDLFSVGVVLAELLTGRRLFAAANELDVLLMVRDAKLHRFDKYGADLDPALSAIVRKALRKPVDERWQSAAQFRDALGEWLYERRHRVTGKLVADLVHELRGAVVDRRHRQMAGNALDEASGPLRMPSQSDGVVSIEVSEPADHMPSISVSYEAPPAEPRAISVSDLAAAAQAPARLDPAGPRTKPPDDPGRVRGIGLPRPGSRG